MLETISNLMDTSALIYISVAISERKMEETIGESENVDSITVFPCLDLTDAGKRYFLTDWLNMEPAVPL